MGMEIDYNQDKDKEKKNKRRNVSRLQSVNPAKSGLPIITSLNAMDSQEWVESD